MEHLYDHLLGLAFGLMPLGKDGLKTMFGDVGLIHVWELLRDHIFSYKVWILGLLPCLFLERWFPAIQTKASKRAYIQDGLVYPIVGGLLVFPFVAVAVTGIKNLYHQTLPFLNTGLLDDKPLWLQLLGAFLIVDLMFYISHRTRHEVKWFWYFHSIHHSQEHLNPLTTHRTHVVEKIISAFIITVPIAFIGGAPITWAIYLVLNNFWGYFIHANIRTNLGPLKYILVTPQFHRCHHSVVPEHFDRNYGERLILWDFLFGTMVKDFNCYPPTGVKGIERWVVESGDTSRSLVIYWFKQTVYPFYKIGRSIEQEAARVIGFAKNKRI